MAELHIDISRYSSKALTDIPYEKLNTVITLCDDAAAHCPYVATANAEHWSLPDPAQAIGSEEVRLRAFYQIRDVLNERIAELYSRLADVARRA
jgi:arsenate reductase